VEIVSTRTSAVIKQDKKNKEKGTAEEVVNLEEINKACIK